MPKWLNIVFLLLGAGLLVGCSEDFGTACDFPQAPEINEACSTRLDDQQNPSVTTCIDTFNADCSSRLCVSFQGSSAFCSESCSSEGDCPSQATCQTSSDGVGVCVPDFVLDAVQ